MGSPRNAANRRRRISVDPEPACVRTPWTWGGRSARHSTSSESHQRGGKTGPPVEKVSGSHVVRGRQYSPVPARSQQARSPWTRPSAPGRGYTSKALASVLACTRSRVGTRQSWLRGRYRLGHWPVVLSLQRVQNERRLKSAVRPT